MERQAEMTSECSIGYLVVLVKPHAMPCHAMLSLAVKRAQAYPIIIEQNIFPAPSTLIPDHPPSSFTAFALLSKTSFLLTLILSASAACTNPSILMA